MLPWVGKYSTLVLATVVLLVVVVVVVAGRLKEVGGCVW
jgi:hypothetical protein